MMAVVSSSRQAPFRVKSQAMKQPHCEKAVLEQNCEPKANPLYHHLQPKLQVQATAGLDRHFCLSRSLGNVWTQLEDAFNKGMIECLDNKMWKKAKTKESNAKFLFGYGTLGIISLT